MSPRRRRTIYTIVSLILFYILFGFLALPPITKSVLVSQISKQTNRECKVEQVRINPLTLSATIRGFHVADPDQETLVSWDELHVNFQLSSFFGSSWNFKSFLLEKPHIRAEMKQDGSWNFSDLLESTNAPPAEPTEPKGNPPVVRVQNILIDKGTVNFADHTRQSPFKTVLGPYTFGLNNLNTATAITNAYSFNSVTATDEQIAWSGNVVFDPLELTGNLSVSGVKVQNYSPYYAEQVRGALTATVALDVGYSVQIGKDQSSIKLPLKKLSVESISVSDPEAPTKAIDIPNFTISDGLIDVLKQTVEIASITTSGGKLDIEQSKAGALNIATLLSPPPGATPAKAPSATTPSAPDPSNSEPAAPWSVLLRKFELGTYSIRVIDQTVPRPVELNLGELSLKLSDVTTEPGKQASLEFSTQWNTNGTVQGKGAFGAFPPAGEIELDLAGIALRPVDHYLESLANLELKDGVFSMNGKAIFSMKEGEELSAGFKGGMAIDNLQTMARPADDELLAWKRLQLDGIDLDLKGANIGAIAIDGLRFNFEQGKTNNNLATLMKPSAAAAPSAPAEEPSSEPTTPYNVGIGTFSLTNSQVSFADLSNPSAVHMAIDDIAVVLTNISTVPGTSIGLDVALNVNTNGAVQSQGTFELFPPKANLKVKLASIGLDDINPYLEPTLDLLITDGELNVDGQAIVEVPTNGPMKTTFKGDVAVKQFQTKSGPESSDLVNFGNFRLSGIDFQLDPPIIAIETVGIDDFNLMFLMTSNANNFANLSRQTNNPTETNTAPVAPEPATGPEPKISVGEFALNNINLNVEDQSMSPPFKLTLDELTGKIAGISSEKVGSGTIDLRGKVDKTANFNITGKVDLLTEQKDTDVTIKFQEIPMLPFGPYIGKFLGYKLDDGSINIDVRTTINGRDLSSENVVVIDRFNLGDTVSSPDAIKAPIKLGIALLKDPKGQIELDVPVKGNLDDPEFKYGKVVWRTIMNLFLKAATSPFALLSKVAGGKEDDDLSYLEFAAGQQEPKKISKLNDLAKALKSRPGLRLDITGGINEMEDMFALQRIKIMSQLKTNDTTFDPIQFTAQSYTNTIIVAFAQLNQATNSTTEDFTPEATEPEEPTVVAPTRRRASGLKGGAELLLLRRRQLAETKEKEPEPTQTNPKPSTPDTPPEEIEVEQGVAVSFVEMETRVAQGIETTEDDLKKLAQARAERVKTYLIENGEIAADRLSIVTPTEEETSVSQAQSRVFFTLK